LGEAHFASGQVRPGQHDDTPGLPLCPEIYDVPFASPVCFTELGTELQRRLRSSGGRPALADATEFCRVPLSTEDVKALEEITTEIEERTGTKPSVGQAVSVIVRHYVTGRSEKTQEAGVKSAQQNVVDDPKESRTSWLPCLDEIAGQVGNLQETARVIEKGLNEMRRQMDRHGG
jgi:hypothetical protein